MRSDWVTEWAGDATTMDEILASTEVLGDADLDASLRPRRLDAGGGTPPGTPPGPLAPHPGCRRNRSPVS